MGFGIQGQDCPMDIFTTNRPRTVQMAFTPGIQEQNCPEGYMNKTVQIGLKPGKEK